MKTIKNLLYLTILTLVVMTTGYFIYSYTSLNDKNIPQEYFRNGFYKSLDQASFISFANFDNAVYCVNSEYFFIKEIKYEENILSLINPEHNMKLIVIEETILYSSEFNTYFYSINSEVFTNEKTT